MVAAWPASLPSGDADHRDGPDVSLTSLPPLATAGMTVLAGFAIVGPLAAWWLASRRRAAGVLAVAALVPVLVLTLSPTSRTMTVGCAVDWSPRLTAAEPLANVLLFVPLVLLLAVATARPVRAALSGSALSAGIELLQAVATPLGRSCDTSDWIANSAGSAIGAVLAAVGLAFARWHRRTQGPTTSEIPVRA
ncbi:VanZ family protein [Agrococcus sp. SGAir0287]|uniref:VanZ family protein n=1 Tax=Agrococcus sp. SGAir0287 TaxID=2070347 RepID=UPI0010F43911|nr:VanZ family protein [Agrococcus sp. SGAir0287]